MVHFNAEEMTMKNNFVLFGTAVIVASLLSSCAKEIATTEEIGTPFETTTQVEMTILASGDATKTYIDGTDVKWADSGEKLAVLEVATPDEGDAVTTKATSKEGETSDSGATMTFDVSWDDKSTGYTSFDYYAFYPSGSYKSHNSVNSVNIEVPSSQTPTATSFAPAADLLIASPVTGETSQNATLDMQFTRAVAVGKMTITNLPTDEAVTEVRFSAIDDASAVVLAGRTSFNLETAVPTSSYGNNTQAEEIILDYSSLSLTADSSMDVFFTCFPFELAAGDSFTVTVKTATYTYTRTISLSGSQALAFTAGKASRFSVNMGAAEETVNAQDIPYAVLTYDAAVADGFAASYLTRSFTDVVGGKWEYNAYKSTGIQIKNCSKASNKTSYIKLPVFKENIRKIEINLAEAYSEKSLRFDSSADSYAGGIYTLSLDTNTSFTLTSTELGSIKTAYIHAYGAAVNITSIEVYAGDDNSVQLSTPTSVTAVLSDDGEGGKVPNSITVSWNSVDNADYYIVTLTPTSGDPVSMSVTTTTATIEDLEYETTYSIEVVAYANNKGLYSASNAGTCSDVETDEMPSGTASKLLELDLTTKAYGTTSYSASTTYGNWTIVNGANNNKGWTYFKMGGKSATLENSNPCYIYSTVATTAEAGSVTVHIPSGSLSKTGMSVTSWGVYVYSDSAMETQVDYVAGDTISSSEGTFTFTPSSGVTWASGSYFKVSWTLANTTTTNGIVCVDNITVYSKTN